MKQKIFITVCLGLIIAVAPLSTFANTIDTKAEAALLAGDWNQVIEILAKVEAAEEEPVLRLLRGHANLATNRNNDAMLLFLSVRDQSELILWAQWTDSFLEDHPEQPIAQYLAVDALARIGSVKEAIEGFTRIIQSKTSSGLARALALNAQGVAYVLNNNMEAAQVNFYLATKQVPKLADAFANLGTFSVFQEASLRQGEGALDAFNQALIINPDFALAINGRGCLYFGSGEFSLAEQDFQKAGTLLPNFGLIETNLALASAYGQQLPILASMTSQPGMSLTARVEQRQVTLQTQQEEMKDMPDEKIIFALPHMSPTDQRAVVNQYGWKNVEKAGQLALQKGQTQMVANNQEVLKLTGRHKILHKLDTALFALKTFQFTKGIYKDVAKIPTKGGKALLQRTEKSVMTAATGSHTLAVVIDAIDPNPVVSTMSSVQNIGESVLKDQIGAVVPSLNVTFDETMLLGRRLRNVQQFFKTYPAAGNNAANRIKTPAPLTQRDIGIGQTSTIQQLPTRPPLRIPDPPRSSMRYVPLASQSIQPVTPPIPQYTPPHSFEFQAPRMQRFSPPPGGVDTEITAFIDKGNWPVLTVFGLFYQVKPNQESKSVGGT